MKDNGFVNAAFLRKCKKVGMLRERDLLPHWNKPDEPVVLDGVSRAYQHFSAGERHRFDLAYLAERGYIHRVTFTQSEVFDRKDRRALNRLLERGDIVDACSVGDPITGEAIYLFRTEIDAVYFKMLA